MNLFSCRWFCLKSICRFLLSLTEHRACFCIFYPFLLRATVEVEGRETGNDEQQTQPPTMNSKIRLSAVTLLCTILIIKYFLRLFAWMIPTLSHLYCLYVCRVKVIFHVDLNACHFPEPSLFELLYIPQLGFVLG